MSAEPTKENKVVSAIKESAAYAFLNRHAPFLLNWQSLFYFVLFVLLVGFGWTFYTIESNSGTMLMTWDYTWQFIDFAYDYHDQWRLFFSTGQFPLYDPEIYLGVDNIGSNSYYGLFDPFVVVMALFPREWIPQMFTVMTIAKITVCVFFMRMYLKYMGISEWTARFGALAVGFSGYINFMVGFPSTISAAVYLPLILYGIERVIKEGKPSALVWGLALEGITSFFFLVVFCIFGAVYAVWRYFVSIKTRDKKENIRVIIMGVASFAVGILLSAWTLLPSLRASTLSGRTQSLGTVYLQQMIESFKSHDWKSYFGFAFEEVGDSPNRQLMGLVSFFFPSGGYYRLPLLATPGYDSWTASVFCYTPFIILFFCAILHSIVQRKWHHLFAVLICLYLLFTNFAYYAFYAFTGNGYGRWYLVLIPLIVYYGCWAFEQRESSPKVIYIAGTVMSFVFTLMAYWAIYWLCDGKRWTNPNGQTYFQNQVTMPHLSGEAKMYLYGQLVYIAIEGILLLIFTRKKWMPHILVGMISIEIVVAGFFAEKYYIGNYDYASRFMGGSKAYQTSLRIANNITDNDGSFYRTYFEKDCGNNVEQKSYHNVLGLNATAAFHSLMNFDVEDFALMNRMKAHGDYRTVYHSDKIFNASWSGYYYNKRFATDTALGYRYYVIKNNYSDWVDWVASNIPFGAEEIPSYTQDNTKYRIYRIREDYVPQLGYAVDENSLYYLNRSADLDYVTDFYDGQSNFNYVNNPSPYTRLQKSERSYLRGGIFLDDAVLPEGMSATKAPKAETKRELTENYGIRMLGVDTSSEGGVKRGLICKVYTTPTGELMWPSHAVTSANELNYFLEPGAATVTSPTTDSISLKRDNGRIVLSSDAGTYLSNDPNGCYIEMKFWSASGTPRVFVLGDTFDEDGNLVAENQLLTFEHYSFQMAKLSDDRYYNGYSSTFGLYCRGGKAKYIVLCWPSSGNATFVRSYFTAAITNYSKPREAGENVSDFTYMEDIEAIREGALQNVQRGINHFTFETHYDAAAHPYGRIVTTQLGYDAGWKVKAVLSDGSKKDCPVYKLNGGLVGFHAPTGDVTYTLYYETPYLKLGAFASLAGFLAWAIFMGFGVYKTIKVMRKKKSEEESSPKPEREKGHSSLRDLR